MLESNIWKNTAQPQNNLQKSLTKIISTLQIILIPNSKIPKLYLKSKTQNQFMIIWLSLNAAQPQMVLVL